MASAAPEVSWTADALQTSCTLLALDLDLQRGSNGRRIARVFMFMLTISDRGGYQADGTSKEW